MPINRRALALGALSAPALLRAGPAARRKRRSGCTTSCRR
jgi:hypothetical protein